jgi:DNA adenine methylase
MIKKPYPTYNGGKAGAGTYQNIINHIPACDVFIDAMCGNLGVSSHLQLPPTTVLNDIDKKVCTDIAQLIGGMKGVTVTNEHYTDKIFLFDGFARRKEAIRVFFFFDPPYLKETRKSPKNLYRYEWTEKDHQLFLTDVQKMHSMVMITHYPCQMYDEALTGWYTFDFESNTRSGLATERIYMNYPPPTVLQDYRYIGSNYIHRQQISRKQTRWIEKLQKMPPLERNALINKIQSHKFYNNGNSTI